MLEPLKKITIIDETKGNSSLNPVNSLNIATFIVSPTGPVERTTVTSQNDLLNKYCSGSQFSATDNTTIHHIGALVADSPVDVIRVDTSTLREGKTSTGLRYITDKNFNPISTYEIVGINNQIESRLAVPQVTYTAIDGVTYVFYSGPERSDFSSEVTPVHVTDINNNDIPVTDVDLFLENLNRFIVSATNDATNVGAVRNVGTSSAIINAEFDASNLINVKKSTIAETTSVRSEEVSPTNTSFVSPNDNVIIGGYTFYYEGDGTTDTSSLANPIPVTTNLDDTTKMDAGSFIVGVHNALLNQGNLQAPAGLSGNVIVHIESDPTVNAIMSIAMSNNLKDYVTVLMEENELGLITGASLVFLPSSKLIRDSSNEDLSNAWIRINYADGSTPVFWFNSTSAVIPEAQVAESMRVYPIEEKTPQRFAAGINELIRNGAVSQSYGEYTYSATMINLIYSSENEPGLAVSSTSNNFSIAVSNNLYNRMSYSTGSEVINSQVYSNIYINIGDYSFYIGDASNIEGLKMTRIKVSSDPLNIPDFLDAVVTAAGAYFNLSRVSDGILIATDSDEGYEIGGTEGLIKVDSEGVPVIIKGNQDSLTDKFAIIARFPSDRNNFKFSYTKNSDETYDLTLNYNGVISTTTISFNPDAVDGYGTSLYYEKLNEGSDANSYFFVIELTGTDDLQSYSSASYGGYFKSPVVTPTDIIETMNKYKDFTDKYYNYIWDAGYANPIVAKGCATLAEELKAQFVVSYPSNYKKVADFKNFRESTGIDSCNGYSLLPSFRQAVIGTFLSTLSESLTFLRAKIANFNGVSTEFSAVYGPNKGKVISPNLTVRFTKEEREDLLDYQLNTVMPTATGYQINLNTTMQSAESYLSEEQNVQMINVLAHICDEYADNLIAEVNDVTLWNRVISELTERIRARMIANKNPSITNFRVVMDKELNPTEVVEAQQAVFQVWVQLPRTVRYVLGYVKVMRLGSF